MTNEFQPTRPRGARPPRHAQRWGWCSFNPRAHAGRDVSPTCTGNIVSFQPTRPRGARRAVIVPVLESECFNPRAHAGRDPGPAQWRDRCARFNPRAHAGRDTLTPLDPAPAVVSTHAPTRGATLAASQYALKQAFQPTRPRGARHHPRRRHRACQSRFNPRAHAGRDPQPWQAVPLRDRFNPRAHAGRDRRAPTLSHEPSGFNPRAHAGRDLSDAQKVRWSDNVSTHAPTRGATGKTQADAAARPFQPTRPRGARPWQRPGQAGRLVSTHAPTRGATSSTSRRATARLFQPTRPRGARPMQEGAKLYETVFQPTRPRGARLCSYNSLTCWANFPRFREPPCYRLQRSAVRMR